MYSPLLESKTGRRDTFCYTVTLFVAQSHMSALKGICVVIWAVVAHTGHQVETFSATSLLLCDVPYRGASLCRHVFAVSVPSQWDGAVRMWEHRQTHPLEEREAERQTTGEHALKEPK